MKLEFKDVPWLIEFANKFNDNITAIRQDLIDQLDLLAYLNETLVERKPKLDEHDILSEQLVLKFYLHGQTVVKIGEGYNLTSKYYKSENFSKLKFIDLSSLLIVGRAQLECLLMYNHIYVNSKDINEQKLRYYAWIYTALLNRKDTPANSEDTQIQKDKDKIRMESLKTKMMNLPTYKMLKPNQQTSLFKNGTSKLFKQWKTIFLESNYPEDGMFVNYTICFRPMRIHKD